MRDIDYAIVGAGAIGSVLAAHLARAGHEVAVLARGTRAAQVARDGLVIEGLAEFRAPVRVMRDPAQLRAARVLVLATKTPGTAAVLASLGHLTPETAFSIQNGPGKNELLAAAFGRERTLGALANTSAELLPSGAVLFTRNVNVFIGELPEGTSGRVQRIVRELDASGVRATETPRVLALEWSKFCAWTGLMALSVTTRRPTWAFLVDSDAALVIVRVVREMVRLADRLGIAVSDESVLPVASIARGSDRDAIASIAAIGASYRRDAAGHRMSSLQDLNAGRPLEVHETLGYALELAGGAGLELPVLQALYGVVAALDPARNPPSP